MDIVMQISITKIVPNKEYLTDRAHKARGFYPPG